MTHLQVVRSNLSALESAARDLSRYRPRQWADVQMCRMLMAWYVKRLIKR